MKGKNTQKSLVFLSFQQSWIHQEEFGSHEGISMGGAKEGGGSHLVNCSVLSKPREEVV